MTFSPLSTEGWVGPESEHYQSKKDFLEYILEGERDVSEMKMRFRRFIIYDSRPRLILGAWGTAAPLATLLCEAFERHGCLADPLSLLA